MKYKIAKLCVPCFVFMIVFILNATISLANYTYLGDFYTKDGWSSYTAKTNPGGIKSEWIVKKYEGGDQYTYYKNNKFKVNGYETEPKNGLGNWLIDAPFEYIIAKKAASRSHQGFAKLYQWGGVISPENILKQGNNHHNPIPHSSGFHVSGFKEVPISQPEPTTWILFGTGLLGLACFSRKKPFKKT